MITKIITPTPFAVGDVNCFLLKGDTLTLVDAATKTPEAREVLQMKLKEMGYTFNDIEQVFVTHHHPDHCGLVEMFDRAEILGHPYLNYWLTRDTEFLDRHDRFYEQSLIEEGVPEQYLKWVKRFRRSVDLMGGRPVDRMMNEGDDLPGHPGWKIQESLGHAQSHLSLFNEQEGILIGGDLLLEKVSSNPLIEPPFKKEQGRPKSLLQYNASLERLLDLPVSLVYGGHGGEITNAHELITERLAKQRDRAMKVLAMLDESKTVFDVTKRLFPAVYEKELGLTLSETIGQLDYLVAAELISETVDSAGVHHYVRI
ncbi:MBL fold metallo-hydrolase [Sporosarcina sp. P12(2017)]|uniref:MBL fold metallo-hydrolase n=1 Tax=unclassified Sporosarcina TaxID=2647733 RepID=UPI000C1734D0|nr:MULTISPECIES: MBL fold metallo-hydrolase [unclassified Sporosarcina]PIC59199.1 MBL fold metallo-hydrolase [Sporosarcina sp. P10]PIC62520.1 MBL fold metallo-hydrolase [Sporosarcina sp. P12(2017)]PIC75466.1 MBL fold metallo-hydrolase [Sporosarcina sp. P19]